MKLLELSYESPALNLALDEALVETAEMTPAHPEVLRIWEPRSPAVIVGRSSPVQKEVNLEFCQENEIPVLRRVTGGASIVTGPGCLMYAVLLDLRRRPQLKMLDQAHAFVMQHMAAAVGRLDIDVAVEGICDLTVGGRKVSGNSLRCKRHWLVYHGTMICDFDTTLIGRCLKTPVRQPAYRQGRSHDDFVSSLATTTALLAAAIVAQWQAEGRLEEVPQSMAQRLAVEKYSTDRWLYKIR